MANAKFEEVASGSPEYLVGFDASGLPRRIPTGVPPKLRRAWARYKNQVDDFVVLGWGSSSMRGHGSYIGQAGKVVGDAYQSNFLKRASDLLTQRGEYSIHEAVFGNGLDGNTIATYDKRVTFPAGNWINAPGVVLGGLGFRSAATGSQMQITPSVAWDVAEIMYVTFTAAGTATVKCNGVLKATIDRNTGAETIAKATVTADSIAIQPLLIEHTAGSSFRIANIRFRRSDRKQVEWLNAGWVGMAIVDGLMPENYFNPSYLVSGSAAQSPYRVAQALAKVDLALFYVGGNDTGSATPAQVTERMGQWGDLMESLGATVCVLSAYRNSGSGAPFTAMMQAEMDYATSRGWMVIDLFTHFGAYGSSADWWMAGGDLTHMNAFGQHDAAELLVRSLFP